jgi:hypothetical protein
VCWRQQSPAPISFNRLSNFSRQEAFQFARQHVAARVINHRLQEMLSLICSLQASDVVFVGYWLAAAGVSAFERDKAGKVAEFIMASVLRGGVACLGFSDG